MTIGGIPKDIVVIAAAAACPIVDHAIKGLCLSQAHGSPKSQFVNKLKCNPLYPV